MTFYFFDPAIDLLSHSILKFGKVHQSFTPNHPVSDTKFGKNYPYSLYNSHIKLSAHAHCDQGPVAGDG